MRLVPKRLRSRQARSTADRKTIPPGRASGSAALESPTALISYAHADGAESVDVLAQELRLRGMTVVRDIQSFRAGRPVDGEMRDAIGADLVVGHLGPGALVSDAVMNRELSPALQAFSRDGSPSVVLVPHGIGATRAEIDAAIAGRLPYCAEATWAPAPQADASPLTSEFAATVAHASLHSLYGPGRGPSDGRWQISLATRGKPRQGDGFAIDATELLGGPTRRAGVPEEWSRLQTGINDLAATLGAYGTRRSIAVTCTAHSTAGVLLGLAFNRAAHWELSVATSAGDCLPSARRTLDGIRAVPLDGPLADRQLFVGIDLASRNVAGALDRLCAAQGARPGKQIVFERIDTAHDLSTQQVSDAAAAIASQIKTAIDDRSPERLDLFIAAPAPVSVLLGAEMATLGLPIGLWEHDDTGYIQALELTHPR